MLPKYKISFKCFIIILISTNVSGDADKKCWISFDAKEHFKIMDDLDDHYAKVRNNYQETVGGRAFDEKMSQIMLSNRGIAERALHAAQGDPNMIPAGINLGGYCMMKMPDSILFFHRMKLRNNTHFNIETLENDLANLVLKAELRLNDLHLFGSFDLANAHKPGHLTYIPTFGQIEILLKSVIYYVEGRYRLLKDRLNIELLVSDLDIDDILIMHRNPNFTLSQKLDQQHIEVFTDRLKVDLDKWLKDYFNDYLMYFVVAEDPEFEKYNQERTKALNKHTDKVIDKVISRIHEIKADAIQLPSFTIQDKEVEKEIRLRDGVLRGLDSIYRRSIATGVKENKLRKIDAIVGFSDLKLTYRYDAILKSGLPPVTGVLILSADDLTAHMGLALVGEGGLEDPESADITFKFLEQAKSESLTVEGPANRMISNFKYILERHIIAVMTNVLVHNIDLLGTIERCVPLLPSYSDPPRENAADIIDEFSAENAPNHENRDSPDENANAPGDDSQNENTTEPGDQDSQDENTTKPGDQDSEDANTIAKDEQEDNTSEGVTSTPNKPSSEELKEDNNSDEGNDEKNDNVKGLVPAIQNSEDYDDNDDDLPDSTSTKYRKNRHKILHKNKPRKMRLKNNKKYRKQAKPK